MKHIQVFTTTATKKEAEKIANRLARNRLAACIQIVPVSSIYIWKGKIEKSREFLLIVKSSVKNYKQLETSIKNMHSYENPEIIAIPIIKGSKKYISWLKKELK